MEINEDGVCNACLYAEKKKTTDWNLRRAKLDDYAKKYQSEKGYDCIVPVSGGKDSPFQVYYAKKNLNFHLLFGTFNR